MNLPTLIILIAGGLLTGFLCHKFYSRLKRNKAHRKAEKILRKARRDIEAGQTTEKIKQRQDQIDAFRESLENQIQSLKTEEEELQNRIEEMSERLEHRRELAQNTKQQMEETHSELDDLEAQLTESKSQFRSQLEEKAGLDREQIRQTLKQELISRAELRLGKKSKSYRKRIENHADRLARRFHNRVLPRCDMPSPADVPSAALKFPDQDAYDQLLEFYENHQDHLVDAIGSDIRFEEEKQLAVIENMEPVQKEIAYRTVNNIVQQKKFDFDLIENGVKKYERRVHQDQMEAARRALRRCSIDNVPDELLELLGVLSFRTSYGQPQLLHSMEVSLLSSLMAAEIGADAEQARRAGLLHDIGKAVDRQRDSGHAVISGELAEEAGENEIVTNALRSHHGDFDPNSVESVLVAAADAISGSRPGARKENITDYSERIKNLRKLAKDRPGVRKVYAMAAGRELRIWVDNREIKDSDLPDLARQVASDIEENLTYSGEIKVNTIREKKVFKTAHIR